MHSRIKVLDVKIVVAILVLSCVILLSGRLLYQSFAYMQDKDTETNHHTIGSNESEILQTASKPLNLNKGNTISYSCKVRNTGTVPCYVRVMLVPSSNPDAFKFNTISCDSDINSSAKWYHEEGVDNYYYYKQPLQPGESTPDLLNNISLLESMSEELPDNCKIFSYEETHQSEGYSNCLKAFE